MINGGNATVYVKNLDRSILFYTDVLRLKLQSRSGKEWANIDAGNGLIIGLQPTSLNSPPAGRSGSICIGFMVDEPLDRVVAKLKERGVQFRGSIQGDPHAPMRLAFFGDPDGNDLYVCENAQKS
jgi:catechol 2,3-dioxygenase-like lactoylglutathione lyase family enzyme